MTDTHEHGIFTASTANTDQLAHTTQRLLELGAYGPVAVLTREEVYTADKGHRPLPTDRDSRRIYRLGQNVLTVTTTDGAASVTVATPEGDKDLPLGDIEHVTVDHPLGHYMPLTGRQLLALGVRPEWAEHSDVLRWERYALETFSGGHMHEVIETAINPDDPGIGIVRAYDISTPLASDTPLEVAQEMGQPFGLYYISKLGALGAEGSLTVITSRMGYRDLDRTITVLSPKHPPMPARSIDMRDVVHDNTDREVLELHQDRVNTLSAAGHGRPLPLTLMDVDDTFLYATFD